jgi:hypothetical protein
VAAGPTPAPPDACTDCGRRAALQRLGAVASGTASTRGAFIEHIDDVWPAGRGARQGRGGLHLAGAAVSRRISHRGPVNATGTIPALLPSAGMKSLKSLEKNPNGSWGRAKGSGQFQQVKVALWAQ